MGINKSGYDIPGGPVVKTLHSQCKGFDPQVRELRSCMPQGAAKKKKSKGVNFLDAESFRKCLESLKNTRQMG